MIINFAFIDVVLALLIFAAAVRGAMRGFLTEVGSMAAVILGIGGAVVFAGATARLLEAQFGASLWNEVISFLLLFLIIYIVVKLLENLLHNLFARLSLERLDRVLGFFLGLAEGALLAGLILLVINWQPFFETKSILAGSVFARILFSVVVPWHRFIVPQAVRQAILQNA